MDAAELIHRRTALGLSRRELAREIGVDHVTVWRWEVQERTPTAIIRREVERTLKRLERTRARRPSAASRAEIERTLVRFGATAFSYGWDQEVAVIGFRLKGRVIRFKLPMPSRADKAITHTPEKGSPA
jgi:transcriptional regulator with XRE-family HTH domain